MLGIFLIRAVSMTVLVSCLNSPSGPVRDSPVLWPSGPARPRPAAQRSAPLPSSPRHSVSPLSDIFPSRRAAAWHVRPEAPLVGQSLDDGDPAASAGLREQDLPRQRYVFVRMAGVAAASNTVCSPVTGPSSVPVA